MRILHTVPALDCGGIDRIVYDYSVRMSDDFHLDFITHTSHIGVLEGKLKEKKDANVFHIPPFHTNRKKYFSMIKEIMKNGNYDIIHVSQGYKGLFFLYFAKKYGVKVRIAHSHTSFLDENTVQRVVRWISTIFTKRFATHLYACGTQAAIWMWGKKDYEKGNVTIIPNAIEMEKYLYNEEMRESVRDDLGLNDSLVIGNVARFSYEKNHAFIIDVFKEILKKKKDAKLVLIGDGELFSDIQYKIKEYRIEENVLLLGKKENVNEIYNAMDIFLLPSLYEGLPVTLVEAQCNGITSFVSDTITKEVLYNNNVHYLSLKGGVSDWAETIIKTPYIRSENNVNKAFDINEASNLLKQLYYELVYQ